DAITDTDADSLAIAGRALQLLRSPKNANRLYAEARAAGGPRHVEELLREVDLYLGAWNTRDAAAALAEGIQGAPAGAGGRDGRPGFDALERRGLAIDPEYSQFHSIVGEYAEWEHRYAEIVELMRRAVKIDPKDARARATLGLNLIHDGREAEGVAELQQAFD